MIELTDDRVKVRNAFVLRIKSSLQMIESDVSKARRVRRIAAFSAIKAEASCLLLFFLFRPNAAQKIDDLPNLFVVDLVFVSQHIG